MPMISVLAAESSATITKIPYDVLREIFDHCLPRDIRQTELDHQPNTKIAPMLLCQVCASWRKIVLESATLWSYLYFVVTMARVEALCVVRRRDVDFIRWWRKHQGSVAPCLAFSRFWPSNVDQDYMVGEDGIDYILEYLVSEQYLNIAPLFWEILQGRVECGKRIAFPNPRSIVGSGYPLQQCFPIFRSLSVAHPVLPPGH